MVVGSASDMVTVFLAAAGAGAAAAGVDSIVGTFTDSFEASTVVFSVFSLVVSTGSSLVVSAGSSLESAGSSTFKLAR